MATLVFHLEDEHEIVVPLEGTVTVGSCEGNDVLVEDSSIAPSHAEVSISVTGNFVVRDLGSESGTFVNGRRVKAYPLCEGDEVAFGSLRGHFIMDEADRAFALERENEERDLRRRLEQLSRECAQLNTKHRLVLSVLQGLGEEEKKRLDNLDNLQRAVNNAERILAEAEAGADKAREEALRAEKLRAEHAKLEAEIAGLKARRDAAISEEREAVAAARKEAEENKALARQEFENEKAGLEKQLEERKALIKTLIEEMTTGQEAGKRELAAIDKKISDAGAVLADREGALAKVETAIAVAEGRRKKALTALEESETAAAQAKAEKKKALQNQKAEQEALEKLTAQKAEALEEFARQKAHAAEEFAREKAKALQELEELSQKQSELASKKAALAAVLNTLEVSVRDMTQRQSEGILALRERERALRDMLKAMEASKAEQEGIIAASRDLNEQRAGLQDSLKALTGEIKSAEARIAELNELAETRNGQITALADRIRQLEEQRDAVSERVQALAGTEEELLQARQDLLKAREDHAAFVALVAERDTRQRELDALTMSVEKLNATRAQVEETLAGANAAMKDFQRDSAAERDRVTGELQSLESETNERKQELAALVSVLEQTAARHDELLRHSAELAGVEDKLRRTNADFAEAQKRQADITTTNAALTKESESIHATVKRLQGDLKTVNSALDLRREEEAGLSKSIAGLQAEQAVERKRLAEIRESAAEAARRAQADRVEAERKAAEDIAEMERKAAAIRAELDAAHEKRRRDILAQEDQFRTIQSLREEIDELYGRIDASGEEDAVAALAAWREAKKKKEELTDLLPKGGGIRVKPQGRTVLVRRSKDV